MAESKSGYHHGDLREALILAALEMLEAGEPFSLRAIARSAGVSTAAPYRHFADRDALESALAVHGLRELMSEVSRVSDLTSGDVLGEIAVAYVRFAQLRPELFRLMFGRPCDDRDDERVRAAGALHEFLEGLMRRAFPHADPSTLATAGWAVAHGLAVLHLDGKLDNSDQAAIDARVRSAVAAVFPVPPLTEGDEA